MFKRSLDVTLGGWGPRCSTLIDVVSCGVHEALTVQHCQKLIVGAHVRHSAVTTEDLSLVVEEDLNPVATGVSAVVSAVKLVNNLRSERNNGKVSVVGIKEEHMLGYSPIVSRVQSIFNVITFSSESFRVDNLDGSVKEHADHLADIQLFREDWVFHREDKSRQHSLIDLGKLSAVVGIVKG